ncbi:MAG TPA: glutathione S-transferase family protein [Polyangiaceae bacterium]|nr:glutathione S-transferase family protein [Polyangiaceae bacterium]
MEPPFRLYDYALSGNGWKIRTLLRHLGYPFAIHWVDILAGEQHTPWFVAKNPVAQIPVLEDSSGQVWTESNAILETMAEHTPLLPSAHARHEARAWMCFEQTWVDGVISRARFRRRFPDLIPTSPEFFEVWRGEGARALRTLERHLTARHYLVGDSFSVADISLYAYVHVAHEAGFDLDEFPNLSMWLRRISREPGVLPVHVNPEALESRAPASEGAD